MLVSSLLPLWYQYGVVFVFGLIIGSFLNVYIYRFHTGKSLSGHSHCLSCGKRLRATDLVPLLSYLYLKGRCRMCGCYIPMRYFIVELLTGGLFLLMYTVASNVPELVFLWFVTTVFVVITVYDVRHYIIPDALTLTLTIGALLWYGYLWSEGLQPTDIGVAALAALSGTGFFFLLWFISKGTWLGFGDVKLAFPLGLIVGPTLVFSMVVYSFWIGAAISLLLVGLGKLIRGQLHLRKHRLNLTIKSVVPFAPFMIAGCLVALSTKLNVLSLFTTF